MELKSCNPGIRASNSVSLHCLSQRRISESWSICLSNIQPQPTRRSITYTDQVVGSGTLGGTAFTNALVIVTLVGETGNVVSSPPSVYNTGTATVNVAGIGVATFLDTFAVYVDTSNIPAKAGIADFALHNGSLVDTENTALAAYDLRSAYLGPYPDACTLARLWTQQTWAISI